MNLRIILLVFFTSISLSVFSNERFEEKTAALREMYLAYLVVQDCTNLGVISLQSLSEVKQLVTSASNTLENEKSSEVINEAWALASEGYEKLLKPIFTAGIVTKDISASCSLMAFEIKSNFNEYFRKESHGHINPFSSDKSPTMAPKNDNNETTKSLDQDAESKVSSSVIPSYIQTILQDSWRIPSTAKNGMSAVVEIRLHPDGTIDSAALSTSSGDEAFDRSVLNAVKRARVFELVADVDPVTFERQFRRVLVTFRPEGLRQ